jgi:hypothetical protein
VREDLFDLLLGVSKGAFKLWNDLKYRRDEKNNLSTYPTSDWSVHKQQGFSRHLRELRDKDMIKIAKREMVATDPQRPYKTPKQTYMINPHMMKCWDWEDAKILWDECRI